jgi:hypothetical protein
MHTRLFALVAGVVMSASVASAQDLSGTYIVEDEEGRTTLTLRVDAQGGVTGSVTGPDVTMSLRGRAQGNALECVATIPNVPDGAIGFRGQLVGSDLTLDLVDPQSGEAIDRVVFTKQGGAPTPTPTPAPAPQGTPPPNPLAPRPTAAPFAGRFSGDGLVLELAAQGQAYAGTLTFQGQTMPCRATIQGTGLAGSFNAGGTDFPFEATPDGAGLRLTSGGHTYALKGERPAAPQNPLAGGNATGPGPAAPRGDLTVEAKHALGVVARLPTGWRTQELPTGVQLVPAGQADPNDMNAEVGHFLLAEEVLATITTPDDPQVVAYLDRVMAAAFQNLRRAAEPQVVQTGAGATAVLVYAGVNPQNGRAMKGRVLLAIVGQKAGAILSVGYTDAVDQSDATARAIAGSLTAFHSPANPRLIGKWGNNGGWSSSDNKTYSSSRTTILLRQDGAFVEDYLGYVTTPAGMVESTDQKTGRWTANGATLTLQYANGEVSTLHYQFNAQGNLVCAGPKGTSTWGRTE